MRPRRPFCLLSALALAAGFAMPAGPAVAQQVTVFGDSIVEGFGDNEGNSMPRRLRKILRKADEAADVLNFGLGGEKTFAGLTRINLAIAEGGDIFIIMEGTNDVEDIATLKTSIPTVAANLNQMVSKVRNAGIEPVLSTIIWRPPTAQHDKQSLITEAVAWEIRELSFARRTRLIDGYRAFDPNFVADPFREYYFKGFDPVGHPNPEGHQRLARTAADVLQGIDNVSPVIGAFSPGPLPSVISRNTEIRIPIYEPLESTGLDLDGTRLLINNKEVGTIEGSTRKLEIVHQGAKALGCRAVLQLQTADRAAEPNAHDRVLGVYDIQGLSVPNGDVDFDCRVDGFDLISLSQRFGARRGQPLYNSFFDFDFNGVIDQDDLDVVISGFGRS